MDQPEIQVKHVHVEPNNCPLDSPLTLVLKFSCQEGLEDVSWEVRYMVDLTAQRHILQLGSTLSTSYAAGSHEFQFSAPQIDVGGLKHSWLNNVGLLLVVLKDATQKEVFQISMVTQIEKRGDMFYRNMLSPLD